MVSAINAIAASDAPELPEELIMAIRSAIQAHPDVMIANSKMLSAKSQVEAGGYPQGEASGDMGSMLNLELAHSFTPQVRGVLFYDYGHIRTNRDSFSLADNARTLAGAGLGVNALLYGWQLDSYVAWPTQGGTPLSEPASSERMPRLWVQMSGEF